MRLGIFGGSFDPVHYGHLLLAEICLEEQQLDRVLFLPAATPPHKVKGLHSSPSQRVEMLRLAIAGHTGFDISTYEIDRGGVNYTADTLEAMQAAEPGAELFFLMGGDSLKDLPSWRDPERLLRIATPLVVGRVGSPTPDFEVLQPFVSAERLSMFQKHQVVSPLIELSSTDIRDRAMQQQSIRFRTPRAVETYIQTQKLYRLTSPSTTTTDSP